MTGFQLAMISLSRRPFPSILAVVCIGSACLAADFLVSFVRGQTSSLQHLESDYDLIIGPKSSGTELLLGALGEGPEPEETIPYALVRYLGRVAELKHRIPIYFLGTFQDHPVVGTDKNYWERPEGLGNPNPIQGRHPSATHEIVLGKSVASQLDLKLGDPLKMEIHPNEPSDSQLLWTADFEIVGIVEHTNGVRDNTLFIPLEEAWRYYRWKVEQGLEVEHKNLEAVSYVLVSADPGELDFVETRIHEGSTVQVVRVEEELAFLKILANGANRVSNLLCLVVLLLASLSAAVLINARFDSIKQELGVMRALGYTRGELTTWLTLESFIPALLAVTLAIALEFLLFGQLGYFPSTQWTSTPPRWPEIWNISLWVLFLSISFFASALPLYRLYRTDIRTAMEGV